jgi:hypothetical protein
MAQLPKQVQKLLDIIEKENNETVDTVKGPSQIKLGSMLLFVYSPKWSKILPFYDVLPLAIPLARYGDRLLAINCHYIPYVWRVSLTRELMKRISWKKRLQYKDIKQAIKSAKVPHAMLYYAIRTYLYSHVMSSIKEFHSQNFEMAVQEVMPRFKKETEENIYKILMSKMYKRIGGLKGTKKEKQ